jgi:hypothetical protein
MRKWIWNGCENYTDLQGGVDKNLVDKNLVDMNLVYTNLVDVNLTIMISVSVKSVSDHLA